MEKQSFTSVIPLEWTNEFEEFAKKENLKYEWKENVKDGNRVKYYAEKRIHSFVWEGTTYQIY